MQKDLSNQIAKSVPGFNWFTFLDFQLRCHQNVRRGRGSKLPHFSAAFSHFLHFLHFSAAFSAVARFFRLMQQQGEGGQEFEQLSHTRTNIWTADHRTLITNPHLIENTDFQPKCHNRYFAGRPPNHNDKSRMIITSKSSLIISSKSKPFEILKSLSSIKAWRGKGAFQTPPFNDHIRSGHFGLHNLLHILMRL